MNYYGKIVSEIIPAKDIYQFLQEALKQEALKRVTKDNPFRGPNNYKKDDFKYINKTKGNVEKFEGQEIIFYKNKLVYKLNYHVSWRTGNNEIIKFLKNNHFKKINYFKL